MSSWKKYFSAVPSQSRAARAANNRSSDNNGHGGTSSKYSSYLPEVYSGAPNRVERYVQYEQMDLDTEINKSLDVISDFSTQNFGKEDEPFTIVYKDNLTETEITLLKDSLAQWSSLNKWQQRLWRAFRNVIKYGDQMYIRDPETFELIWVDPTKVEKIIVNENRGKDIEQYVIRDIDLNLQSLVATSMLAHDQYSFPGGYPRSGNPASGSGTVNYGVSTSPGSRSSRFNLPDNNYAIDGTHVVHLSLSEGMDNQWPFGTSILESIYKVYKQKDLLEDSIIIYRIVRAPERRIFYIDVGNLQGPRAMQYVERIKNEIYQRRIPNRTGGGASVLDAAYSPIAINEDFFLAQNAEGKGSRIETLPGGENLGQIDDLKYFNNKMIRGLGIPSSYLPTGPDDGTAVFSDGKVGTAFVQEYRFTKYCQRLQNLMAPVFDREFKLFLKHRGIEIQSSLFDLQFWEPQSFSDYRKIQKDSEHINLFTSIMGSDAGKYISKRYALVRYLGWTEEDVLENEKKFQEENADKVKAKTGKAPSDQGGGVGLENVGIRDTGGMEGDMGMPPDLGADLGGAELGGETPPGGAETGGAAPPPPPGGGL
ncbi:portal vertex protein [uncultured Caudovirales phage]|uniref:Portal vertex protein n=1 Tax=uncultured Caudovirales phage TaxID=2100421 RepID=A0A6J5KLH0_9CAUD|nr:portal vertex protein [uncultured Caudovirales phage]